MASWARTRLLAAAGFLLLSLLPWQVQAGTEAAPEFTDNEGDPEIQGILPIGQVAPVSDGVDLLAGWVEDNATALLLSLKVAGDISLIDPALNYDFDFHFTVGGTELVASAHWADGFTAGGAASEVNAAGSVLQFVVPKATAGVFRGDTIDGLYAESSGTLVTDPLFSVLDRAPDTGTGTPYNVTQGLARGGTADDTDADGLPDAWETEHFAGIEAQNGTGDPDSDDLNNTRENALGTDPNDADTDGDGLEDGTDPDPLVGGASDDSDGDGLNDTWEREHFTTVTAQDGTGDPDDDGLNNTRELALDTDPNDADTDGDGLDDGTDPDPLEPASGSGSERKARPELYSGAAMFAIAATFILLGLAKGI